MAHPVLALASVTLEVQARRILEGVSLEARGGEFIGLVGPNGAGKTTLLRTILGLYAPKKGVVFLEGCPVGRLGQREVARRVGYVPQALPPTFAFTALDVVLMGRYPHMGFFQMVEDEEDRSAARAAMEKTGTLPFARREVTTLSGGERQRVFLARALAQRPRLLLLDEPIANLDLHHQVQVLEMIRGIVQGEGVTAVAALHNLELAAAYCHRLVLLHQGRVVADGPPEEVLTPHALARVFGIAALVYRDPVTGRLVVRPLGPLPSHPPRPLPRVHVVCGGGSGGHLLYLLYREGFPVTAGPLGEGDTDRLTASALGIPFLPLPAFSPIDDAAHRRHREMVRQADAVVLCPMPIGPHNLRALEAMEEGRCLLSFEEGPFPPRDFTGGRATRLFHALPFAARCSTPQEVLSFLARWEAAAQAGRETAPQAVRG
jgi:iron complex transport system ATP-binding protein